MTRPATCYRLRPYFRNVGVMGTTVVAVLGLGSVGAAYFNIDNSFPNPLLAATVFGIFWSCFLLLGLWLILLDRRYCLFVTDESLRQRGVVSDRTVALNTITEIRWRRFPEGGSVRLIGAEGSLAIELGNFSQIERGEVVAFLRASIPDDRQYGWDAFHEVPPKQNSLSRRGVWVIAILIACGAVWGFVRWSLDGIAPFLLIAIVNTAGLVYVALRLVTSSVPRHGEPGVGADSR